MGPILPPSYYKDLYKVDEVLYTDDIPAYFEKFAPEVVYVTKGQNSDSGNWCKPAHFDGIEKYTIDEEAATRWIGRNLQTFAHEISGVNVNGDTYNGWLLDFNSSSDYLVEVWIDNVNSTDGYLHDYTNITDNTIAMIKKSDLYQWLKSKNSEQTIKKTKIKNKQ